MGNQTENTTFNPNVKSVEDSGRNDVSTLGMGDWQMQVLVATVAVAGVVILAAGFIWRSVVRPAPSASAVLLRLCCYITDTDAEEDRVDIEKTPKHIVERLLQNYDNVSLSPTQKAELKRGHSRTWPTYPAPQGLMPLIRCSPEQIAFEAPETDAASVPARAVPQRLLYPPSPNPTVTSRNPTASFLQCQNHTTCDQAIQTDNQASPNPNKQPNRKTQHLALCENQPSTSRLLVPPMHSRPSWSKQKLREEQAKNGKIDKFVSSSQLIRTVPSVKCFQDQRSVSTPVISASKSDMVHAPVTCRSVATTTDPPEQTHSSLQIAQLNRASSQETEAKSSTLPAVIVHQVQEPVLKQQASTSSIAEPSTVAEVGERRPKQIIITFKQSSRLDKEISALVQRSSGSVVKTDKHSGVNSDKQNNRTSVEPACANQCIVSENDALLSCHQGISQPPGTLSPEERQLAPPESHIHSPSSTSNSALLVPPAIVVTKCADQDHNNNDIPVAPPLPPIPASHTPLSKDQPSTPLMTTTDRVDGAIKRQGAVKIWRSSRSSLAQAVSYISPKAWRQEKALPTTEWTSLVEELIAKY